MQVQLIELKSEISAGTRGASRSIDAIMMASLNLKLKEEQRREKDWNADEWTKEEAAKREAKFEDEEMPWNFFRDRERIKVENCNQMVFDPIKFRWAKRIEGLIEVYENMVTALQPVLKDETTFPVVLAGDHGTAGATIKGIKKAFPDERIGVVWIDAHGDLHSPYTTPSGNMHGMPLCIALNEDNQQHKRRDLQDKTLQKWNELKAVGFDGPAVKHEDIVFIGLRSVEVQERAIIERHDIESIYTREVRERGYHKAVERAMHRLKDCDKIYISFDIDSVDSTISSGTGTPVPDGLLVEEARGLLNMFAREPKVCCMEMVEVNPFLDPFGNRTGEIAFDLLYDMVNTIEHERT